MHNNTQLNHDPQNAMAKLSNVMCAKKLWSRAPTIGEWMTSCGSLSTLLQSDINHISWTKHEAYG